MYKLSLDKLLTVRKFHRIISLYDPKYVRRAISTVCKRCENNRTSLMYYNFNSFQAKCSTLQSVFVPMLYSTSVSSNSIELVDSNVFEKVCEETLESLSDFFEVLVESKEEFASADVSYSGGVLTVNLGNKYGTYVINRQSPNRQIWLSSPISGPKRYDYVVNGSYWIYKHDSMSLHELLQSEVSKMLHEKIDLSKCLYSKV